MEWLRLQRRHHHGRRCVGHAGRPSRLLETNPMVVSELVRFSALLVSSTRFLFCFFFCFVCFVFLFCSSIDNLFKFMPTCAMFCIIIRHPSKVVFQHCAFRCWTSNTLAAEQRWHRRRHCYRRFGCCIRLKYKRQHQHQHCNGQHCNYHGLHC